MRKITAFRFPLVLLLLTVSANIFAQKTSIQNIEPRLEALLAKMTLDEKIGQLNQVAGDISTGTDVKKTIC